MSALNSDQLLKGIKSLPALPLVVQELLLSMNQDDINVAVLARKIALDPGLTARSLRLANSSFYGMANQVTTIQDAIAILGFRVVRGVVTAAALMEAFTLDSKASFKLTSFWQHAIAVALCARELAPFFKINPEYGYTTGLLHDLGRLVLLTAFPAEYEATLAYRDFHDCDILDAELAVIAIDHAEAGHLLAKHWKFPHAMQLAIASHHKPLSPQIEPLGVVLVAANAIAHALDLSSDEDDCVPNIPTLFWQQLGLGDKDLMLIFSRVEKQFAGASLILTT